eukprot:1160758-Pelagomonas_calceolata.AAC.8
MEIPDRDDTRLMQRVFGFQCITQMQDTPGCSQAAIQNMSDLAIPNCLLVNGVPTLGLPAHRLVCCGWLGGCLGTGASKATKTEASKGSVQKSKGSVHSAGPIASAAAPASAPASMISVSGSGLYLLAV